MQELKQQTESLTRFHALKQIDNQNRMIQSQTRC